MKMKGVKIALLLCLLQCAVALTCMACSPIENSGESSPLSENSGSCAVEVELSDSGSSNSSSSFSSSSSEQTESGESESESSIVESDEKESSHEESSISESSDRESSSSVLKGDESSSSEILPHVHEYKSQVLREPTCEGKGIVLYECACEDFYTETTKALGHDAVKDAATPSTCVSHGASEGSHCSRCDKILVAQQSLAFTEHTYQYGYCSVCNLAGLTFSINHEYNYAICTGYACLHSKVRRVEIPDTYYGYPVKEIAAELFADCRDLYSVEIGANVEIIGENAFYGCYHLTEVYDRSKAQVSKMKPSENGLLLGYVAEEDVHYAPFESKIEVKEDFVLFHEGKEDVRLLTYLGSKKAVSIPEGVTRLTIYSLRNLEVEEIVIPSSVNYIEKWAFHECLDLKRVRFMDPDGWEAKGHDHSVCEEGKLDKYEENMPNWTPFEPGDLDTPENGKKAIIDLFNAAEWRKNRMNAEE